MNERLDDRAAVEAEYQLIIKKSLSVSDCTSDLVTARQLVCNNTNRLLAVSLSNNNIRVFDIGDEIVNLTTSAVTLSGHTDMVTGLRFSTTNPNILYSSSIDGTLRIWDLRKAAEARKLFDGASGSLKPLNCFDVDCEERHVCSGTELIREDSFILFWDLRGSKLLGGYWESHTDDITAVRFRPGEQYILASGSDDGLINLFDISESSEEDALLHTMNTELSVDTLAWYPSWEDVGQSLNIACLTLEETVQLWDTKEVSRLATIIRDAVDAQFESIRRSKERSAFITLNVDNCKTLGLVSTSENGDVFLSRVDANKKLVAHSMLSDGHKLPITTSYWNTENGLAVTCDEDGHLCIWRRHNDT